MARLHTDDDIVTVDPIQVIDDINAAKAMLDHCRERFVHCPSGENETDVEDAQTRLNEALDRLPR